MRIAVTRELSASIVRCELTHRQREPIDLALARRQHHAYEQALRALGLHVLALPALDHLPDAVFVEDTAVVVDEVAVLANPGAASRRPEIEEMVPVLSRYRRLERLPPGATLDGGDVVQAGQTLYVGLSRRTNQAAVEGLGMIMVPHGYRVVGVPLTGCLHLKTACTRLGPEELLVNRNWVDPTRFAGLRPVDVPAEEPDGGNVLTIDGSVVLPEEHSRTADLLERRGWHTVRVPTSELIKAEAGVTCGSIIFFNT